MLIFDLWSGEDDENQDRNILEYISHFFLVHAIKLVEKQKCKV